MHLGRLVSPTTSRVRLLAWLIGLVAIGCRPKIGDHCKTSTDCSQVADRLCDISQPDGYCTIYNCEPKDSNGATKCPDEAACIVFAAERSAVTGCANRLGDTPYSRTFCMRTCENQTDCRNGYICIDVGAPGNQWAAVDADGPAKVCTQPFSASPLPVRDPAVCTAMSPEDGTGGAGETPAAGGGPSEPENGSGGAGATSGSAGMGGA
ncbi:MAG TPA: hypothetical protein VGQ57_05715 [Polyangiaceae bacterium]|jgi:hypothetical protein|nr:hypothetical protein [Polyangiaceae bacterium]